VRSQFVGLADVVPTLLEAAGVEASAHGLRPDGTSLLPAARDDTPTRDVVVGQVGRGADTELSAISRDWKYIYSCADNRELLFRFRSPEQELVNHAVFDATAPVRDALRQTVVQRLRGTAAGDELLDASQTGFRLFPAPRDPRMLVSDPHVRATARSWQYARWDRALPHGWTPPPSGPDGTGPAGLPLRSDRSRYRWAPTTAVPGGG
jgi:hypothetical protein